MSPTRLRIIKLGGSLLNQAGLAERFADWFEREPRALSVLIVGGGQLVNVLRRAEKLHGIDELTLHWLAVRAMSINARLVASLFDLPKPVTTLDALQRNECPYDRFFVFDVEPLLRDGEPQLPGKPLPHGWHVTSDSIAARIAEITGADELVLLKSAPPLDGSTRQSAADSNYVDAYFPQAAWSIATVRCVDLRDADFRQELLSP